MILEEKLFDQFEVNFPVEREVVLIHGANGTGKTLTLELLQRYFESQGENVIYFPFDRKFSVTEEEISSVMMMHMLTGDSVFKKYEIEYNKLFPLPRVGEYINSGFHQIVNMFCKIVLSDDNPIVLIDMPERSLHISISRTFIDDLLSLKKIKKLIVVTHCPSIASNDTDKFINIEDCVKLY